MELNQKMEESKIKLAPDNAVFQEKLKKDVDLDYPQEWYMTILYYILGTISLIFIK